MLEDLTAAGLFTGSVDDMMAVNLAGRLLQVRSADIFQCSVNIFPVAAARAGPLHGVRRARRGRLSGGSPRALAAAGTPLAQDGAGAGRRHGE